MLLAKFLRGRITGDFLLSSFIPSSFSFFLSSIGAKMVTLSVLLLVVGW